ncbi:MAG TPA: bifunctional UDP-sugar hydrolase/5'-nucleotidase [Bacillota bacterium]|nr:bifunctional UDP-sugar hydrolase/5'-nucleotidase [Bacillota bacterium]
MQEQIYFYYTNDLHSDFTYWPQVVHYFHKRRIKHKRKDEACFIVDIGDHIDRVHPIAEAFMGKGNVQLLNEASYDVITIGNNEGITLSHDDLFHLYNEAQFDVVCSNLNSLTEKQPDWLNKVIYKQTASNVKIAILGLTAAFNPFYNLLDWHVEEPTETLHNELARLTDDVDIVILLSHLGLNEDRSIAKNFPQIDLIIGGHTHHLLKSGEIVRETLLTAAGKHCSHIGEVMLLWDHEKKKLVQKEAYVTNITHMKKDEKTVHVIKDLQDKAHDKMSQVIAETKEQLTVNWYQETFLMKKLTNTLKKWTKADCAMLPSGLLLDHLPVGEITLGDVHRICPHPINPVVVNVSGREIKEIVRVGQTKEFMNLHLKGFGFRGKVIGKAVFSGITFDTKNKKDHYIKDVFINNKRIVDEKIYSFATADMFIFGRLLPEVAKSKRKDLFLPEFIRDILVHTLYKV